MPIYDYECPKCGKIQEVLKKTISDTTPVLCPNCKCKCNKLISTSFSVKTGDSYDSRYDNIQVD